MNILGVLTFSALFGWALSSLGEWRGVVGSSAPPPCSVQPAPVVSAHSPAPPHPTNKPHTCPGPAADGVVKGVGVLNAAVGRMVGAALWVSPLGIASLIAASILRACDLAGARAPRAQTLALVCLPCFVGHRPPPPGICPHLTPSTTISPPPHTTRHAGCAGPVGGHSHPGPRPLCLVHPPCPAGHPHAPLPHRGRALLRPSPAHGFRHLLLCSSAAPRHAGGWAGLGCCISGVCGGREGGRVVGWVGRWGAGGRGTHHQLCAPPPPSPPPPTHPPRSPTRPPACVVVQGARDAGCEDPTINFFLPLSAAINLNGTALYEAVTAIFIAQASGWEGVVVGNWAGGWVGGCAGGRGALLGSQAKRWAPPRPPVRPHATALLAAPTIHIPTPPPPPPTRTGPRGAPWVCRPAGSSLHSLPGSHRRTSHSLGCACPTLAWLEPAHWPPHPSPTR